METKKGSTMASSFEKRGSTLSNASMKRGSTASSSSNAMDESSESPTGRRDADKTAEDMNRALMKNQRNMRHKEFRLAFQRDLEVVDTDHPIVQKKCWLCFKGCMIVSALTVLIAAILLTATASAELNGLKTAGQAKCKIVDFGQAYGAKPDPKKTWQQQCKQCYFNVQAVSEDHGIFMVEAWKPKFSSSYRTGARVKADHEQFRCCPTEPTLDCCTFYDENTMSFCDNWGKDVDLKCPMTPWPCYMLDIEKKLAEYAEKNVNVRPEDLLVGEINGPFPRFVAGIVLIIIGTMWLSCFGPCWKWMMKIGPVRRKVHNWEIPMFRRVPESKRTVYMKRQLQRWDAAILIQRRFRAMRAHMHREADDISFAPLLQDSPTGPGPGLGLGAFKSDEAEFDSMDLKDQFAVAARVAKKVEDAKRNPQFKVGLMSKPETMSAVGRRLLYDTGNPATFRKLVNHRVLSAPGDEIQRIECAVMEEADLLAKVLHLPGDVDNDQRPFLANIPNGSLLQTLGLAPGLRLQKVNKVQYPRRAGAPKAFYIEAAKTLMEALSKAPRPLFLIFEGRLPPPQTPWFMNRQPFAAIGGARKASRDSRCHPEPLAADAALSSARSSLSLRKLGDQLQPLELRPSVEALPPGTSARSSPKPPEEPPPGCPSVSDSEALALAAAAIEQRLLIKRSRTNSGSSGGRPGSRPASGGHARRRRPCSGPSGGRRTPENCSERRSLSFPLAAGSGGDAMMELEAGRRLVSLRDSAAFASPPAAGRNDSARLRAPTPPTALPAKLDV